MTFKDTYSEKARIKVYQCDEYGNLKVADIMRLCQEVSTEQCNLMGATKQAFDENNQAFVLVRSHIKIDKLPKYNDEVTITTWANGNKGAIFIRNFTFHDKENNLILTVATTWVLINTESRKIIKPNMFFIKSDYCETQPVKVEVAEKLKISCELTDICNYIVTKRDIDWNMHMNNTVYIDLCHNYSGINCVDVKEVLINYNKEILLNQNVLLKSHSDNDTYCFCGFVNGKCNFEIILKTREERKNYA